MRFSCPGCDTWQEAQATFDGPGAECTCRQCGVLLRLHPAADGSDDGPWQAEPIDTEPVPLSGEDPLRSFLDAAEGDDRRAERLTSGRAQLLAVTLAWSPRLWLSAGAMVAVGLAIGIGLLMVGQRVERSLALLFAAPALGLVAWSMVIASSTVANLLEVRQSGTAIGMGRSLRMILEHGNGAIGSALRYVVLGVASALLLGLLALLGAFPGLAGPGGLAITGLLLCLQVLATAGAIGALLAMCVALLLHPGLAAAGARQPARVFRFVWGLLRRQAPEVVTRAAIPLGTTVILGVLGYQLLRAAFHIVFTLNQLVLGTKFADLVAASPARYLFGAPELLDPSTALGVGGVLVALSIVILLALGLGFIASFMGVSGLLLSHGLDLPARLEGPSPDGRETARDRDDTAR